MNNYHIPWTFEIPRIYTTFFFFYHLPSRTIITRKYTVVSHLYTREGLTYLLHTIEPFSDKLDVLLTLLPHRSVTGVLEGHPLGFFDLPKVIRGDKVLSEILPTVDNERRNANFFQLIRDVPPIQLAGEPTRRSSGQQRIKRRFWEVGILHADGRSWVTTLPSFLVSKYGVQYGERDLFGHRADEASVCRVKHLQAGAVLGRISKARAKELQNILAVRHLSHQFHLTLTPQPGRGEGIGEDDRLQPFGLEARFKLGCEHTSPGVTDYVVLCDLKMFEHVDEFVHEEIDGVELSRLILEVAGTGVTDLIVEEDGSGVRAWER